MKHTHQLSLARNILLTCALSGSAAFLTLANPVLAQPMALLDRHGSRVAIEPYAPNIVRVTIALDPAQASAAPGEGPNAKPDTTGWTHRTDASGDIYPLPR